MQSFSYTGRSIAISCILIYLFNWNYIWSTLVVLKSVDFIKLTNFLPCCTHVCWFRISKGILVVTFTIRAQIYRIFLNMNSELAEDPHSSLLFLIVFSLCPFPLSFSLLLLSSPAEPSHTALNEWCLNWAHRQSISHALSPAAGCLSQTVLEGAGGGEGSGGIRGHFRVHLSCTAQSEGAQVRL